MRVMGLDVGTKTIGVALSDPTAAVAQPAGVVRRTSMKDDLASLRTLIRDNRVEQVVVGLPKNMDGSLGESAARAGRLAEALERQAEVSVVLWDERLSTVTAQRALIEADVSRRRRKGLVDSVAAAIILQSYLDSRRASGAGGAGMSGVGVGGAGVGGESGDVVRGHGARDGNVAGGDAPDRDPDAPAGAGE